MAPLPTPDPALGASINGSPEPPATTATEGPTLGASRSASGESSPGDEGPSLPTGEINFSIGEDERYVLGETFAVGGIGVIRRGVDRRLGRVIAIKELQRGSPKAQRRFALEAAITARLQHPGIVPLYDLRWHVSGKPYYCMKLVDGESLEVKIARAHRLDQRLRLLEYVVAIADAVAYAHEQQVIHRDLKPANVLVGPFGETVVIDWGLAKDLSGRIATEVLEGAGESPAYGENMTEAGSVMGTPRYMSPEQAAGEAVGVRSDVYSLGAVLYHVLTGKPPLADVRGQIVLARVFSGDFADVRAIAPDVPRELAAIAHRAMARDPAERYASAGDFAEDLRRFQAGRMVSAHSYSLGEMIRVWIRRHRTVLGVSALALVGLIATVIAAFVQVTRERDTAEEAREEARRNHALAGRAEVERTEQLYKSLLVQAGASQRAIEPGRAFGSLAAIAEAARLAKERGTFAERQLTLRNAAIAGLGLVDARVAKRWQAQVYGTPGFDGRLEHVAVPLERFEVSVRRVADDAELWRFPNPGYETWYSYARYLRGDAHLYLHYADREVQARWHVYDMRGPAPVERAHLRDASMSEAADGRTVWRIGDDGHLLAVDIEDGRILRRLDTRLDPRRRPALRVHPDGRYLAVADPPREVIDIVDLDADAFVSSISAEGDNWSWGQLDMFAVGGNEHISLWDPLTGRKRGELGGYDNKVIFLDFHPDRRLLGSCSWDGTSRFWEVASQREVLRLDGCFLRFDAEGRRIAVQQHTDLELWEFSAAEVVRNVPGWARTVGFSPDSRSLLLAGELGVELWDIEEFRRLWRVGDDRCMAAVFFPDGRRLATKCEKGGVQVWTLTRATTGVEVGAPRLVFTPSPPMHAQGATIVFPAAEPSTFAVGDGDSGEVRLFDASTLSEIGRLRGEQDVRTLAIGPDGRWVAASGWKSRSVLVWDRLAPDRPHAVEIGERGFTHFEFDPLGRWLVIDAGDEITKWRVGDWTKEGSLARGNALEYCLAIAPDGQTIAVEGDRSSVHLLRASDLSLLAKIPKPMRELWELRFSPDGHTLALASAESGVYLWDLDGLRRELAAMELDW